LSYGRANFRTGGTPRRSPPMGVHPVVAVFRPDCQRERGQHAPRYSPGPRVTPMATGQGKPAFAKASAGK